QSVERFGAKDDLCIKPTSQEGAWIIPHAEIDLAQDRLRNHSLERGHEILAAGDSQQIVLHLERDDLICKLRSSFSVAHVVQSGSRVDTGVAEEIPDRVPS